MLGSTTDTDPGPAPPPSLTLPPLREIDKTIRPDPHVTSPGPGMMMTGQPQPLVSDPHHQHQQQQHSPNHFRPGQIQYPYQQHSQSQPQQQPQQQQRYVQHPSHAPPNQGPGSHHFYPHDNHSRQSSSVGSLPDLYMSSSSTPSTTTTSSLSRADSLTTMEYLQGMHPIHHGHARRSAGGGGSITTGSTTGNIYGYNTAGGSGGSTASGGHHLYNQQHHSSGPGRVNLNSAVNQHQRQVHEPVSPPNNSGTSATGPSSRTAGERNGSGGGRSGSSSTEQQGRNSTKRAAQNRAAQRAFRQRKDLYVRELERKADLLQQAEGKIMALSARNRELELVLLAHGVPPPSQQSQQSQPQPQSQSQSQQQPPHHASVASASGPTGQSREQDREPIDHNREWGREERAPIERRASQDAYENRISSHPAISRHASSHQLHHTFNSASPLLANGSLEHQPLSKQQQQQQQQQQHQRPESDYEFDGQDNNPHTRLRHPSESSLRTGRGESSSADSGDDYGAGRASQYTRRGSSESKNEYSQSSVRGSHQNNSMIPEYSEILSSSPSNQQHPSNQRPSLLNERLPLYPISTQGTRSGASNFSNPPSARSWSYQLENGVKPHSPMTAAATSPIAPGRIVSSASTGGNGYVGHPGARAEMEYLSDERSSEPGSGYDSVGKRPSDGAISWTSNTSAGTIGGGHEGNYTSRGFPEQVNGEVRKQQSWSSFPATRNGPSLINAPSTSSPMTAAVRDGTNDMDTQDSSHQQQHRMLHHRASTGSVSIRNTGRQHPMEDRSRMMMSDSPEMGPLDGRLGSSVAIAAGNTSPQMSRHLYQYFSAIGQQQRQRGLPQSPGQEYPPGAYGNSPRSHLYQRHYRQAQGLNDSGEKLGRHPDAANSDMDTVYDQPRDIGNGNNNGAGYNEASMRSP
ncbi:hypothetical protein BGX21_008926 [Mortierella sp. AD011]|nr:hypothetical protein BGX20_007541 [Mortierella sp. AD010]KAF9397380.1 hypothetical protein BGX21_008926 [Mortierella sp. AD011]